MSNRRYQYDVALSFAGEDRKYVEEVAEYLCNSEIAVFYDKYEEATLWGKDLYEHLDSVYRLKAKFCVIFISAAYATKLWTSHECASAQERAFSENREYLLPARFDATDIPGIRSTTSYVDLTQNSPQDVGRLIVEKVAMSSAAEKPASESHPHVPESASRESVSNAPHEIENTLTEENNGVESQSRAIQGESLPAIRSDELFHWRLCGAFPGLRDTQEFSDPERAIERLEVLLRLPHPFWWSRGYWDSHILHFERLSYSRCLLNIKELKIKCVVAVRSFGRGDRDFVYVETEADEPVGCYNYEKGEIERILMRTLEGDSENHYFVSEEFALWNNHAITREEYDDDAAIIEGRPVQIKAAELRLRFLTPYNFIICSQRHVLIQGKKHFHATRVLNDILKAKASVTDLIALIRDIPRPSNFDVGDW